MAVGTPLEYRPIKTSDIRRFMDLDHFAIVVRRLYLPSGVPLWQQLVRSGLDASMVNLHNMIASKTILLSQTPKSKQDFELWKRPSMDFAS